jgi:hypothetical protein
VSEYTVCRQEWRRFPRVLVMRNVETGEERRYVPERDDTFTGDDMEGAFCSGYSLGLDMYDHSKRDGEKGWDQNERDLCDEMRERGWVRSSENDELRELVKDMWHLLFNWLFRHHEVPWKEIESAFDRMDELGIEVD